jgi:ABC-type dipeptide/oligopeptide/nickel transport system permease subunit
MSVQVQSIADQAVGPPLPWTRITAVRRAFGRSAALAIGSTLVGLFTVCGVIGLIELLVPGLKHFWFDQNLSDALKGPLASGHLLGTDAIGRDLLARTLAGIGVSFTIGLAVTVISLFIGMAAGLLAGFFKGFVDVLISGIIDVSWGFPVILLAVMLAGIIGAGFKSIILAVALLNWAGFARIIRGYALSLREREFVEAARALGIPSWRIITTHFIPNVMAPTLVMASYYVAVTIIIESGLSFLGLGVQPPTPSLGQMLADGRDFLRLAPWQVVLPGTIVALAVFGFNILGDALRDILDPRLSRPQA